MLNPPLESSIPKAPKPSPREKTKTIADQSSIIFVYQVKIVDSTRNVTITWTKTIVNHSVSITIENLSDDKNHFTCKIDLNGRQCWSKKGLKSLDVEGRRVEVFWDFRQTKFSESAEPTSNYYLAIVSDEEVVLLIGDLTNDALKRTRKKPSLVEANLLCKKEHVYGKKMFCTKAILDESKRENHDVVVETSLSEDDPEMWISVDGTLAIRIMNLNWRFRGNESVMVNNISIEIFWDVHDWLFSSSSSSSSSSSQGLFIFKPDSLQSSKNEGNVSKDDDSIEDVDSQPEYRHVLHAWKID